MASWLRNTQIPVADFYDLLLARYYGKMFESSYDGITLRVYNWDGKYYVEEVK
jgi:hypothetical protein